MPVVAVAAQVVHCLRAWMVQDDVGAHLDARAVAAPGAQCGNPFFFVEAVTW